MVTKQPYIKRGLPPPPFVRKHIKNGTTKFIIQKFII